MIRRRRSVGSLLKPFVYREALRDGADTEDMILDTFRAYPTDQGKDFIPFNYIPTSYGPLPLREALGNSLNSATVRITEQLGLENVYRAFREIGLDLEHDIGYYGYGLSIGTAELTLENIVESIPSLLDMSDMNNFLIMQALRDPSNRARTFGESSILNSSIPLPVKTGTSTDFRDNWAISYHPHAIIGVWVGNNNHQSMRDISGITGA